MGTFEKAWVKIASEDRSARFKEKMELMKRYGVTQTDLEKGKWRLVEEGPMGQTTLRLYKLVETVTVAIESQVRATSTVKTEEENG